MRNIKKIEKVVKEFPELEDYLDDIFSLLIDAKGMLQMGDMTEQFGKYLPFELILKLNSIYGFPINEIEYNFGLSGFNKWYRENFGKTVRKARKKIILKDISDNNMNITKGGAYELSFLKPI